VLHNPPGQGTQRALYEGRGIKEKGWRGVWLNGFLYGLRSRRPRGRSDVKLFEKYVKEVVGGESLVGFGKVCGRVLEGHWDSTGGILGEISPKLKRKSNGVGHRQSNFQNGGVMRCGWKEGYAPKRQ